MENLPAALVLGCINHTSDPVIHQSPSGSYVRLEDQMALDESKTCSGGND